MKTKRFATLLTLLILLINATLAHAYPIQVTYNTNLRAAPSLQGEIVETVAAGTTLHVIGSSDGWLRINRNGNEVWMSKSVSYTRVEGGEGAAQIDNCCFVDRQCTTDEEWVSGYWAFQNNQCAAPSQQQQQQGRQQQQNGNQQQEPKKEEPQDKEPSGDLIFIPLTEEEWRKAYCEIFGGPSCDE